MFGVGGGFLITPLLFFIGIPPAVAVATGVNQVVASSISGVLAHLKRKTVDLKMGTVLLVGGLIGSGFGIWLFRLLSRLGQIDLVVQLAYVVFLGIVGAMMLQEGLRAWMRRPGPNAPRAQAAPALLGPQPAAEDEVPHLGALYQRDPAACWSARGGHAGRDHGRGRRLHHGAGDDLPAGHADQGGDRHLAVPDHLRGGLHHRDACGDQPVGGHPAGLRPDHRRGDRRAGGHASALRLKLKAEQLRILLALVVLAVAGKIALDLLIEPDELYSIMIPGRH
jgi:uncharacterized protein